MTPYQLKMYCTSPEAVKGTVEVTSMSAIRRHKANMQSINDELAEMMLAKLQHRIQMRQKE